VNVKAALSSDDLARACADAMWKEDEASQGLGMEILEVKAGEAVLAMTIQPHMVNGHGIAHGGFIFLLADSAFAFACNSRNERRWQRSATSHSSGRQGLATGFWQGQGKSRKPADPAFTTSVLRSMIPRSPNCAVIPAALAVSGSCRPTRPIG